jgi:hypothetical protein
MEIKTVFFPSATHIRFTIGIKTLISGFIINFLMLIKSKHNQLLLAALFPPLPLPPITMQPLAAGCGRRAPLRSHPKYKKVAIF